MPWWCPKSHTLTRRDHCVVSRAPRVYVYSRKDGTRANFGLRLLGGWSGSKERKAEGRALGSFPRRGTRTIIKNIIYDRHVYRTRASGSSLSSTKARPVHSPARRCYRTNNTGVRRPRRRPYNLTSCIRSVGAATSQAPSRKIDDVACTNPARIHPPSCLGLFCWPRLRPPSRRRDLSRRCDANPHMHPRLVAPHPLHRALSNSLAANASARNNPSWRGAVPRVRWTSGVSRRPRLVQPKLKWTRVAKEGWLCRW